MSAGYQDLYLELGTTFTSTLNLTDSTGLAYNLVGFSVHSQAKQSYYSATPTIVFNASISDAANGTITLTANNKVTSNIPYMSTSKLVYDVIINDAANNYTRVLEGKIILSPGVTSSVS
jgi:hypothetical protein